MAKPDPKAAPPPAAAPPAAPEASSPGGSPADDTQPVGGAAPAKTASGGMSHKQIADAGYAIDLPFEAPPGDPPPLQYSDALGDEKGWTAPEGFTIGGVPYEDVVSGIGGGVQPAPGAPPPVTPPEGVVQESVALMEAMASEAASPDERKALWAKFPKFAPKGEGGMGGFSLKRDAKGLFIHTHRARSKSYSTVDAIPASVAEFIESTG